MQSHIRSDRVNCTKLTVKQKRVFDYIVTFIDYKGYPPTSKEIAAYIPAKSTNSGLTVCKALRTKGAVTFREDRPGSLRPVKGFKVIIKGEQK